MTTTAELLTRGLIAGYASSEPPMPIIRAGVKGKSTHYEEPDGGVYHDEWFGKTSGGGQELVRTSRGHYLRTYYGGTANDTVLSALGISAEEVSEYLVSKITQLGESTRLHEDSPIITDGIWQYQYSVLDVGHEVTYTSASERIYYMGKTVHFHHFGLTPVR